MTFPSKTAHLMTLWLVTFFMSVTRFNVILKVFVQFFPWLFSILSQF